MSEESLTQIKGSDPRKAVLAKLLWKKTTVSQSWIARRFEMSSAVNVCRVIRKSNWQSLNRRLDKAFAKFIEQEIAHLTPSSEGMAS